MGFPVFKAIGAGIVYVIARFFTILQILWLPTLGLLIGEYYIAQLFFLTDFGAIGETADATSNSIEAQFFKGIGAYCILMAVFYPMMFAGLLKNVIRNEAPRLPFYLAYGLSELRILGATIGIFILGLLIIAVFLLASFFIVVLAGALSQRVASYLMIPANIIFALGILWFNVRMSLVFAASVGERALGVSDSWELTQGRFWTLLFYWVFWILVSAAVGIILFFAATPENIPAMLDAIQSRSISAVGSAMMGAWFNVDGNIWDFSQASAWLYHGVAYLSTMITFALWIVPAGFAYRYMKEE